MYTSYFKKKWYWWLNDNVNDLLELKKDWNKTSIYCYEDGVDMIYRDMKNIFSFLIYTFWMYIKAHD